MFPFISSVFTEPQPEKATSPILVTFSKVRLSNLELPEKAFSPIVPPITLTDFNLSGSFVKLKAVLPISEFVIEMLVGAEFASQAQLNSILEYL